jgi:hypothetical protein
MAVSNDNMQQILAVVNVDRALLSVLLSQSRVFSHKKARMAEASRLVMQAIEVARNAHRQQFCTCGQLIELERIQQEIQGLVQQ